LLDPILQGNFNCDFQTVHGSAHDWWESWVLVIWEIDCW
jgi:hypothetical protein